jgi:LysM repeat protein
VSQLLHKIPPYIHNYSAMKRIACAFACMILTQLLSAKTVTYVIFDRDCMRQLAFRFAYPNEKSESPVVAYSMQPNALENYIFISGGAGEYSPELPAGATLCSNLNMSDGFISAINKGDRHVTVVEQRREGGYWLTPIGSAILIAQNGPKYWIRSKNCSFTFDTLHKETDVNLAVSGSPTAVYFRGTGFRNCLAEYSFHCEAIKSGNIRSDIKLIPSLGFSEDRTGSSNANALENEMTLDRVNDQFVDDYIYQGCLKGGKTGVASTYKNTKLANPSVSGGYSRDSSDVNDPILYQYEGKPLLISCSEKLGKGYHVVQRGDNLMGISRTYGVTIHNIIEWNDLVDPDKIEVCQIIWYEKPPENVIDKSVKGVMLDSALHNTLENKVVDQRKINKLAPMTEIKVLFLDNPAPQEKPTDTLSPKGAFNDTAAYEYFDDIQPNQVENDSMTLDKVKKDEYQDGASAVTFGAKLGAEDGVKHKTPQFRKYLTRQGDTLRSIAALYKVDPAALAWLNGLGLEDLVVPGKMFLIPMQ